MIHLKHREYEHDNQSSEKSVSNKEHENCSNNHKGHMSHMLLMILCCMLPILVIYILPYIGITNNSVTRFLPYLMFLLCPLSHLFMMGGRSKN